MHVFYFFLLLFLDFNVGRLLCRLIGLYSNWTEAVNIYYNHICLFPFSFLFLLQNSSPSVSPSKKHSSSSALHINFVEESRNCLVDGQMVRWMDLLEGFVVDMPPLECQLATSNWLDLISGWWLMSLCLLMLSICNLLISGPLTVAEAEGPLPVSSAPWGVSVVCGHTAVLLNCI